jgi:hypothetical protein
MSEKPLTPKAAQALSLLANTHSGDTRSARALASLLWPDRLAKCGTSLRRGGLYRAAGAYYSKLMRAGFCSHWITDFDSGYFITEKGRQALKAHALSPQPTIALPA